MWFGVFPHMHTACTDHIQPPFNFPPAMPFPNHGYSTLMSTFSVTTYEREHAVLLFLCLAYCTKQNTLKSSDL